MEEKNKPKTLSKNLKNLIIKIRNNYKNIEKKYKYTEAITVLGTSLLVTSLIIGIINGTGKEKAVNIASNKAEELFYDNNFEAAIKEYDTLQTKDEWPEYLVKQAEIYSVKGEFKKSNNMLTEAVLKRNKLVKEDKVKYLEKDSQLMNDVVFTFFMNKEYSQALSLGEDYLNNYNDKQMMRTMFTVYMVGGQADKAKAIVEEYPVDERSAYDLAVQAKMYMLIDNWDKGFSTLKDAFYVDKDEVKVYDVITQFAAYNRNDMLSKLESLSQKSKDEVCFKLWMAKIYSMLPETSNLASDILKELENEDIGEIPIKIIKSQVAKHNNDIETSNKILNDLIKNKKESYIGYHIGAWQEFEEGNYDKAFELCKKSILANKEYPDNYGFLIPEIMMAKGESENIESYFRTALSKEPFNYNIVLKIADYYAHTALNNEKAREYYNLAIALKPNDSENYYNLASIDIVDEKLDVAIKNLEKAIKINPSNNKYYRTLGTVYLNKNEGDKAIEAIRQAYNLDSEDILSLNNAGCYYIIIEKDVARGYENIKSAYEEINNNMEANDRKTITDNYNKAKKLYDDYMKGDGSTLTIPEFILFY